MKKYISLLFLIICTTITAQIDFENDLEEAFTKAQTSGKLVFIEYYNTDCPICKKIEPLFNDPLVSSFYNQNFVSYRINTKNSLSLEEKNLIEESELHFNSVPFFLFFDNNSRKLMHYSGVKIEVENILEIGRTALNPKKRTASLKTKYANGDRSVRTLYAYANYLNVLNKENEIIKVTQELFNSFKKEELPTQKSYTILKNVIIDTDNGFFQYWINHLELLKDFETGNKKGTENQALEKIVLKALSSPDRKLWPDSKKENFSIWIKALEITDNPEVFWTD